MPAAPSTCALFALLLLAVGCRSSRDDASGNRAARLDTLAPHFATTASLSTPRTVLITAHDYAFTGVPPRIAAGWLTLRLVNAGREVHMLGIERVPFGHAARAVIDSIAKNGVVPETASWGGPNAVSPGDTSTVMMFFPAGEYVISCSVESAGGKLHANLGMVATMKVTGAADSTSTPAAADAMVTLTDYHVAVRGTFAAGDRMVRVENGASQGHDLEILEILPGHSAADAMRWFEHPMREAPTARAVGGVVAMHSGQQAFVPVTFRPGRYLFLCWVPDEAGHPHFLRGMHELITVVSATAS